MRDKPLDWFAWYPGKYREKTAHLSPEADLAYRRILDEIFITAQDTRRIIDDDDYLAGVSRCTVEQWKTVRRELIDGARPLLRKKGRWLTNDKLAEEIEKAMVKSGKASTAAALSWQSRRDANAKRTHSERNASKSKSKREKKNTPPLPPSGGFDARESFNSFWSLLLIERIPTPEGKKSSESRYLASVKTAEDSAEILRARELYAATDRVRRGFVQKASTWTNNWRDYLAQVDPPRRINGEVYTEQKPPAEEHPIVVKATAYATANGSRRHAELRGRASDWDEGFVRDVGMAPAEYNAALVRGDFKGGA